MAAVDLGELKKTQMANEPIEVDTAFLVVIREGGVQVIPDINVPVAPKRPPTLDEMEMAAHKIAGDLQADKIAQVMQVRMGQAARAMQDQVDAARLAQSLKL